MSGLFSSPDKPKIPPQTPTRDIAAEEAAAQIDEMRRKSQGRKSTILTDQTTALAPVSTTKATILGGTY